MKKSLFFVAAASALMLTACSSENEVTQSAPQLQSGPQAVAFDTYTAETTRAGQAGVMTTGTLQTSGFGVFAQYSNGTGATDGAYDNDPAGDGSKPVANFMWNEKISYSASAWTYSPLKYWPNETDKDSQSPTATSDHADKLSFFAYAPYVTEVSAAKGTITGPTYGATDPSISNSQVTGNGGGIEAILNNTEAGNDPWVRYAVATTPSKSVDLLWGVAPAGDLSYTDVTGAKTTITAGMPLVDLIKPSKDQKIKFLFQHALARIGLKVVAAFDQISAGGEYNAATTNTIIAVNSVTITESTATKYLKTSGALNLKNVDAYRSLWSNTGGSTFTVTVNSSNELNPDIAYNTNASTTWSKHEGAIATPTPTDTWTGVTNAEVDVIKDAAGPSGKVHYFMVIPNNTATPYAETDVDLDVTIDYTVITKDAKLKDGYSEVTNNITKTVTIPKFKNNKSYTLKLILGLTSVKLDAEVADWQVDGSTEVYLPRNNE